jgi:four helix bundle protein
MINERPHKKLAVWNESIKMVTVIYELSKDFPKEEEFGLKSQLRRAAVSVPSNISEGLTRRTKPDKLHFLNMADASLSEIDTQLEISLKLRFIDEKKFDLIEKEIITIQKLLSGLIRTIK